MRSLPIQPISNKKCMRQDAIRSMQYKKSRHYLSESFRSIAYVDKRVKLDEKSEKSIVIDYDNNSKRYKLYNPNNEKIVINKYVIFNEKGKFWLYCEWLQLLSHWRRWSYTDKTNNRTNKSQLLHLSHQH